MTKYNPQKIEKKWQKEWYNSVQGEDKSPLIPLQKEREQKERYYILDMFPYPSGDGLHMGHTESYTASDIIYRYKTLQGFNVLHPQGFDSFGLPAENYAIKTGTHPKKTTETNASNYIEQMKMLGLGHDLNHLVYTSKPSYYKWTQWLFGKFFEGGLVEQKTDKINWCSSCNTGIANEQVEGGKCERCKTEIEQREIPGWFFKITDFADELIDDLDTVDWPEHTKKNQRNWIGKSEGAKIKFAVNNCDESIEVFTTRPDTLFGATYMVLAPEHKLVQALKEQIKNYNEVGEYIKEAGNKTEMERMENKEKTGVKLDGVTAINPATNKEIPIFIADYVLAGYGTGAIMAVPAHDERDFEFAKKFNLEIKEVIAPEIKIHLKTNYELLEGDIINKYNLEKEGDGVGVNVNNVDIANEILDLFGSTEKTIDGVSADILEMWLAGIKVYTGGGELINSGEFDGMNSEEAGKAITEFVGGEMTSTYRLRDWSISRQRYWGCPIPIVYSPEGEPKFVGEENLPWLLPEDVDFMPDGTAPLKKSKELKERTEKLFGKGWTPEVDTMDTFVDSSWYFLRYPDTENEAEFCSAEKLKEWLPVDLYIGGAEHTYMHLLYARFFTKAMKKLGLIDFDEPFTKLRHQGMVLDDKGVKMSKSKGNVINPNDMVKLFGADATRMYMMFAGPLEDEVMFKQEGVKGVYRFLEKVWRLFYEKELIECGTGGCGSIPKEIPPLFHKTIKKVGEDIEKLSFNTAISQMMIFVNEATKHKTLPMGAMQKFLVLLAPFAPHVTEELWAQSGEAGSIFSAEWPVYNPEMIKEDLIEMVVQVNGKVRAKVEVSPDITEEDAKEKALSDENIQKYTEDKEIKKVIFVKGRLISIVVS